jgi:hypothetical protein
MWCGLIPTAHKTRRIVEPRHIDGEVMNGYRCNLALIPHICVARLASVVRWAWEKPHTISAAASPRIAVTHPHICPAMSRR